jgi:UDP-N-acetylmuramoylalanine--D-glutamate ligase
MQTIELKDKDVVVLGLGKSGMAAASLLQRDGARVVVRDEAEGEQLEERANRLRELGVRVELGNHFDSAARFDLAVLSPGIALEKPFVTELVKKHTPVLSELELAYRYCVCPIVSITGTNGKTTTTELINWMLESCGKRAVAAGNIGNVFSEAVHESAGLDALVLEVSSFQLETIEQFRPDIGIWLNLTPDHLDRHQSMDDYARAKARMFMNQTCDDVAIVSNSVLPWLRKIHAKLHGRLITISANGGQDADLWLDWSDGQTIWCRLPECRGILLRMDETNLRGQHNAENILAAFAAGLAMKLPVSEIREAICSYCPQPHRCEFVANINGVTYINDSKGTNVDAVEKALRALPGPVVLIAGGRDKGLDFTVIKEVIAEKVKLAVVIGETAEKIARAWSDVVPCERAGSMAEAVRIAAGNTHSGETVLLSPGCASFDMFENYEHRGDEFKREVLTML